ncbi:MAG: T9SS type A sorting domain-containing protein [Flavobacteriales bacterium]|nr:T9SS type A sorting domain-containing protein [Flavobacteriales bacterium]
MKHIVTSTLLVLSLFSASAQQLEWINSYGSTSAFEDLILAVATDQQGNVYITGSYHGQIQFGAFTLPALDNDNVFIAKLDSSGTCLWAESYGGTTPGAERPRDMVIDHDGNLVIIGNFFGSTTFGGTTYNSMLEGSDIFVLKTDPSGNHLWSKAFLGTGYDIPMGVAVDPNNNIIVSGFHSSSSLMLDGIEISTNSNNATESLIFKLSASGNVQWARKGGASGFFSGNSSMDVAVDASGNAYMTGFFGTSVVFDNITVTGTNYNSYYLAKYSSSGQIQWVKKGLGPNAELGGFGVAVSPDNRIATTGFFEGAVDFGAITSPNTSGRTIFIFEYDESGNVLWHAFGSDSSQWGSGSVRGYTVSYDEEINLYVSGRGNTNWDVFGDTSSYYIGDGVLEGEIFVLKFNDMKELETCSWLETADPFNASCAFVDDSQDFYNASNQKHATFQDNVYLVENFIDQNPSTNTFSLNHHTGVAAVPRFGNGDFLVAKFNTLAVPDIVTTVDSRSDEFSVVVYPNPAHSQFHLEVTHTTGSLSYEIMNSTGQIVSLGTVLKEQTRIDVQGLAPDVYVLRILENGRALHHERVVVMR